MHRDAIILPETHSRRVIHCSNQIADRFRPFLHLHQIPIRANIRYTVHTHLKIRISLISNMNLFAYDYNQNFHYINALIKVMFVCCMHPCVVFGDECMPGWELSCNMHVYIA